MSHLQVANGFMAAFKPIGSFVHDFVSFTQEVQALTHAHKLHTVNWHADLCTLSTCQVKWLLTCCVSPEEHVRNKKHNSDPVPAQLDSSWAGRHVPATNNICSSREAKVWCDKCGGLVPAGGDAGVTEVLAEWRGLDASKHQTRLPRSVVSQAKIFDYSLFLSIHLFGSVKIKLRGKQ